ncbi:signal-regulatory protein beta-2 isoform X2 [Oreochromis niloticus]|uniref:signal-regulatory protein beta-2 isoform X2 n=1 Tax=Oreochromis niloticus TaxID=8128 RepID=UPI000DF218B1|nr:signal-regulatory protein beta-2 isoform X2 [Oreochromis niloticus]
MIVLWMTLFVLGQGYSLVSVKTVQLGEPVTLTCALPEGLQSGEVHWYKQNHGDTLKLIMTSFKSTPPEYGPAFSKSRFKVDKDNNFSNVTILKTVQEDEGIYHCGLTEWIRTNWSGTYLFVKGNNQKTSVVVQQLIGSNPLHPGETLTLQCSFFDSVNKTCPGGLRVLWVRESQKSHPVIYGNINTHNECEKRSDTQERCVYRFSKNVSSSDAGTYYCAVATCGEILFGNGTTLKLEQAKKLELLQMALIVFLAISVIGNIFLICKRRICTPIKESAITEAQNDALHQLTEADEELNYAALNFSERKTRGRKKREPAEESVYSQVK